jgi:hypothetical protein
MRGQPKRGMTGRSLLSALMHKHTGWLVAPCCYQRDREMAKIVEPAR